MTDEGVDTQYTVLAVMLAVPYLNGDHGELPVEVHDDIQATLWRYGYVPAEQLLIAQGATADQAARAKLAKMIMFNVVAADGGTSPR